MKLSFRDPAGRLLRADDRIFRFVTPEGAVELKAFLSTDVARQLVFERRVVDSVDVDETLMRADFLTGDLKDLRTRYDAVFEHPPISFPTFPYEWSPNMLHAAAELTLDLAEAVAEEGFGLKDATPYNVLFENSSPVFVDLLSFELRDECDPTWLPYGQFIRTFILPLMAHRYFQIPSSSIFLKNRDGLEPDDIYNLCGLVRRFTPPFLSVVSIPKWLDNGKQLQEIYKPRRLANPQQARFILLDLFRRLRRQLSKVRPGLKGSSRWTGYASSNNNDSHKYVSDKKKFVNEFVNSYSPRRVLDIGCNTGEFSELAARHDAQVVAIDSDPAVVSSLWQTAKNESLPILPLVIDIARPSPGTGWLNRENPSFIERATGFFDSIFMLAIVHHLLITERIPITEIFRLAANITTDHLIIEFVANDDPMFVALLRGRAELFRDFTKDMFEEALTKDFRVARIYPTSRPTRWLYHARKK